MASDDLWWPRIASLTHQVNARRAASALSELARDNPANQSAAQAGGIVPVVGSQIRFVGGIDLFYISALYIYIYVSANTH